MEQNMVDPLHRDDNKPIKGNNSFAILRVLLAKLAEFNCPFNNLSIYLDSTNCTEVL